jgi:hypothetical protein
LHDYSPSPIKDTRRERRKHKTTSLDSMLNKIWKIFKEELNRIELDEFD